MKGLILTVFAVLLFSCGKVKQIDTTDMKETMRNSKVKRVTEKDLLRKVTEIGESLSSKLDGDYRVECQSTYTIEGNRVELYTVSLLRDSLFKEGVKGQLLEAYKYGIQNKQKLGANVQLLNDTTYAYSFAFKEGAYLKASCGNDFALILMSKTDLVKQL
jgi:hypothetical protein